MIKAGLLGGIAVSAGAGWFTLRSPGKNAFQSLDEIIAFVESLPPDTQITSQGEWNATQVLSHLHQSIGYSMFGFPEQKSTLFQNTFGALAFHVFSAKKAMTHNLAEHFPGGHKLANHSNPHQELRRLSGMLKEFKGRSKLAPHFVFGELTKAEYERIHLYHINDHFTELFVKPS